MKKIVRLTESDLIRLVKKVIVEQTSSDIVMIFYDMGETKFLDAVSINGEPKKVGYDKKILEFSSNIIGKNIDGTLRLNCSGTYNKFNFFDKSNNILVNGYNKKMAKYWCSKN